MAGVAAVAAERPANARAGHERWIVCALLFFATTINYVDRQILSLLKGTLDAELGWTNQQFGLVNAAFQGAYGLGLLGFGWFVDRFGTRIGYAVSIAAWSVAAMGHALVGSVRGFFLARASLGLGEAGNFPSAIKSVALWFPARERAFATALFNSGTNVGAIIAPATIPFVAAAWGWRSAFVVAGALGFVWLAAWWLFYEEPERQRRVSAGELAYIRAGRAAGSNAREPWGSLLGRRQTWAFVVAKFLTDPVWWFFLIWLPDFFRKTRGLDIKKSWIHLVTIYAIVTVLSIAGSWATGALARSGWSITRARKTSLLAAALAVLPILWVTRASDWGAVLLIGLAGAAHQAWSANLFTTVSDVFPKSAVASVVGIGGMAGSVGGMLFPPFAGAILDHYEAAGSAAPGYAILFGICASAYLVAFAIHQALAPRLEPLAPEAA
ncbi:MAG TPA: MFS transporter [Thermoanaerobaculia bacterium]|jgi:ACS family hexuronate transporter-like MFS transporter